jgi:hypothetical protein
MPMKLTPRISLVAVATSALVLFAGLSQAGVAYYDIDGTTAGFAGNIGPQSWDTTSSVWNTDATGGAGGTVGAWTASDLAVFQGVGDDLTIATTQGFAPDGLTFTGTEKVTVSDNTLTLGASGLTLDANNTTMTLDSDITLSAPQTWQATLDTGKLVVNGALAMNHNMTLDANGAEFEFRGALSGSGNVDIIQSGTKGGKVEFHTANPGFSGNISLTSTNNNTRVEVYDIGALGDVAGETFIDVKNNKETYFMIKGAGVINEPFFLKGTGRWNKGGLLYNATGIEQAGKITMTGSGKIGVDEDMTFTGGIDANQGSVTFGVDGGNNASVTTNPITGSNSVVVSSGGTLELLVDSTFTGDINIEDATVRVESIADAGVASPLGAGSNVYMGRVWGNPTGTLLIDGSGSTNRDFEFENSTANLEITDGHVVELSGTLIADGGETVRKTGLGSLKLSYAGSNAFDANLMVIEGLLEVNTDLSTLTDLHVVGGTLAGDGNVSGIGVLHAGGTVSPGIDGVGTLDGNGLTWDGGGMMVFDLGATESNGLLALAGNLLKGAAGDYAIRLTGTPDDNEDFVLATFAGSDLASSDLLLDPGSDAGIEGDFSIDGGQLVFTTIPEPTTMALLVVGGLTAALRRRRR